MLSTFSSCFPTAARAFNSIMQCSLLSEDDVAFPAWTCSSVGSTSYPCCKGFLQVLCILVGGPLLPPSSFAT
jgi:hypothetical protein